MIVKIIVKVSLHVKMSPSSPQQVRNKLATSGNGIWKTTQKTQRTYARANLLRTCYGKLV